VLLENLFLLFFVQTISLESQATRHDAMEGEATQHVVKAAMEEVARKDRVIAQMKVKMARMTLIHEIRIILTKIQETEKRIVLLKRTNLLLFLFLTLLLCVLVAMLMKL
jgi:hypothetical protein